MFLQKSYSVVLCCRRPRYVSRNLSSATIKEISLSYLSKNLNISESKAEYLCLKYPVVKKMTECNLKNLLCTLHDVGLPKEVLCEEPLIFSMLPVTLRFRFRVLKECGITNVSPAHLVSYLPLVKKKTIGELKSSGLIPSAMNMENRLASYMTQWPTSLTTLIYEDVDKCTLYALRLKIIQRYLELVLDQTKEEFHRGLETYPTIKHRPLEVINETLTILQSQVMIPSHKIKTNFYLVHADPDNLKDILFKFRSIGGIDIKEVLRMYPKIATKSYSNLVKTRKLLEEYGISNEAQRRCFEIYTLGPDTVRERLERAKSVPEFQTFFNHPRYLKMIHYNTTATKRLMKLYSNNKKCLSLNILSGSTAHYETFEKAPGDRLGKGKDLVFCISQSLGKPYGMNDVRNIIRRHPFWINIPLVQVQFVYRQLSTEFTANDIYQNCPILLYPWNKIKVVLQVLKGQHKQNQVSYIQEHLDLSKLNKSQKLSLVLYLLEKNHYFTGNGVWSDEKTKNVDLVNLQDVKMTPTNL